MTAFTLLSAFDPSIALAQDSVAYRTAATSTTPAASSIFLPYAQFQIPFNVDNAGAQPSAVQLMVSTDGGKTWQQHGRANPGDRHFDFRAAAEGEYLFTVQTVDSAGIAFPSPNPPMRIQVDTTKPQAAVRADLDHSGNLIVDLRVADDHIDLKSAVLKIRTDRDPQWREVPVTSLSAVSGYFEGQVEVLIPQCREIAIVFSINDQAKNTGSASYLFTMPRTAAQNNDLQLASSPSRMEAEQAGRASSVVQAPSQVANPSTGKEIPGAVAWDLNRKSPSQLNSTQGLSNSTQGQPNSTQGPNGANANAFVQGNAAYSSGANSITVPNHFAQQPSSSSSNSVRPVNPSLGGNQASQPQSQAGRQGNFPTTPRGSNLNALAQQATGQSSSRPTVAEPSGVQATQPSLSRNPTNGSAQQPGYAQNPGPNQGPAVTQGPGYNQAPGYNQGPGFNQGVAQGPGQLARATLDVELSPTNLSGPEELLMPAPMNPAAINAAPTNAAEGYGGAGPSVGVDTRQTKAEPRAFEQPQPPVAEAENGFNNPYYCKSPTFSLDYSVEALGGNALSEVELWGTEDNGRTWEKWGSDPDRVSPFDVKVGNDGLFGFRMVLIGPGGSVMGTPKPGEDADAWIRVDSQQPVCKITRALYGVGSEAGMLVIDYTCTDEDLAEEGITLSWSSTLDGPWTPFASAIRNTGLYLWKADASLPSRVYLKLEAIDKAGNTGTHKMDLPIDTKGLSPRGRIQGIRPLPSK